MRAPGCTCPAGLDESILVEPCPVCTAAFAAESARNKRIIDLLRHALGRAERGELVACAVCYATTDRTGQGFVVDDEMSRLYYATAHLQRRLLNDDNPGERGDLEVA